MLTAQQLLHLLGWIPLMNVSILTVWFCAFVFLKERIFHIHSMWFNLTPQQFDYVNDTGMGGCKLFVVIFNRVPYLSLRLALSV